MQKALTRIYQALLSGENIAIYGDFDVDGITSTALLVKGLSILGARPTPYIPHRLTEGYGLTIDALRNLRNQGISLVISVDCGITAINQIKKAQRIGLDVIVTDHHTPLDELPPAVATINPKLSHSTYPFRELAGVGVALKLLQALFQGVGKEEQLEELLDLVALGTVADMSPLLGENRYLVKEGLKLLNNTPRLGIREMMNQTGLNAGHINAESISWVLAPRLNAAGRLAHASTSYELLMTDSQQRAHELSTWLESKNAERRRLTEKAHAGAREQVISEGISTLLVATDSQYPAGIAGLVASRLADEFYRPAVVIRVGETMSGGSCRSIAEFNIINALNECSHFLTRYGGHAQAAGFSLLTRNVPRLKQQLQQLADVQLDGIDLRPTIDIDTTATFAELRGDTYNTILKLAPFGCGNPVPIFLSRHVDIIECRPMGSNGEHLKLKLRQEGTAWDAVGFGLGNSFCEVIPPLDVVYNLEIDNWTGEERLRLKILDFMPSTQSAIE